MAKRRGNREGSIYKRKDGRWCAQITIGGKRKYKYARTQHECREWLKKILRQIDTGLNLDYASMTTGEYLREWLSVVETLVRKNTWSQYKQIVSDYLIPAFGSIRLWDLKPGRIQRGYYQEIDSGTGPYTVRMMHAVLHSALSKGVKWGYIASNPASVVDKPKIPKREMRTLNGDQVRLLLQAAQGTRFEALYYIAITAALRQGELLGLRWQDLDWHEATLSIQRQLQRVTGEGLIFVELKTQASNRSITLGSVVLEKLREHLQMQESERLFAGERWQDYDLVFPSSIGTPVDPSNLLRDFKKRLCQANLPEIRFHDLRHTAASLMLQEGVHPKVVQERLGHASITLTLDTYSHVLPGMQEEAAKRLDELIVGIPVEFDMDSR